MSQENVDLFLKTIDAWNRDDVEAYVEAVHPEGEFHPGASLVQGGVVLGRDGVREWWADVHATFEVLTTDFKDVRDLGDAVLALGRTHGRSTSGVPVDAEYATLVRVRDGLVIWTQAFASHRGALEAAAPELRAEMIERSFQAFRDDDVEALAALYHPESVWDWTQWDNFPETPIYHGRSGIAEVLRLIRDVFGEFETRPTEIVEAGANRVLVTARTATVRGRLSGVEVPIPPYAQIIEFRDDLIVRVGAYSDLEAGRRAAGPAPD